MALKQQHDQTSSKSPRKAERDEKGPAMLPMNNPRRCIPSLPAALTDVREHFSDTNLIVVRRQLVQKLLYARFFSWAVDVGDLVLGQAAVVLVHLRSKRGDCSGAPWPSPCPHAWPAATPQSQQALGLPDDFERGNAARRCFGFTAFSPPRKRGGSPGEVAELVTVCSVSLHSVSMFRRLRGCVGTCLSRGG